MGHVSACVCVCLDCLAGIKAFLFSWVSIYLSINSSTWRSFDEFNCFLGWTRLTVGLFQNRYVMAVIGTVHRWELQHRILFQQVAASLIRKWYHRILLDQLMTSQVCPKEANRKRVKYICARRLIDVDDLPDGFWSENDTTESCLTNWWRLCSMNAATLSWLHSEFFLLSMYEICVSCLHRIPLRGSMNDMVLSCLHSRSRFDKSESWRIKWPRRVSMYDMVESCFESKWHEPLLSCFNNCWRDALLSWREILLKLSCFNSICRDPWLSCFSNIWRDKLLSCLPSALCFFCEFWS